MTEHSQNLADGPAKFYDCIRVMGLVGVGWPELVAMEAAGHFPKRADAPGAIWHRAEVDAWLMGRDSK
jgi:predicted DNA-binding transcriptional regulator AlpA